MRARLRVRVGACVQIASRLCAATDKVDMEAKRQAAEALSKTKVEDSADGDQQLLDQGIAALFGKKRPAGAGDIAVYLKKIFNEKLSL